MVAQTMNMCIQGISASFTWMEYIFAQLDTGYWILGAFMIFSIYRLLIRPVIGSAVSSGASDTVRKLKNKGDEK